MNFSPLPAPSTKHLSLDKLIQIVEAENTMNEPLIEQLHQLFNVFKSNLQYAGVFIAGSALVTGAIIWTRWLVSFFIDIRLIFLFSLHLFKYIFNFSNYCKFVTGCRILSYKHWHYLLRQFYSSIISSM